MKGILKSNRLKTIADDGPQDGEIHSLNDFQMFICLKVKKKLFTGHSHHQRGLFVVVTFFWIELLQMRVSSCLLGIV